MVSSLIDAYPNTFTVVEYHVFDTWATDWGEDRALVFYDGIDGGVPWFSFDGADGNRPIDSYEDDFLDRQSETTPLTLSVGLEPLGGNKYRITARGCLEKVTYPIATELYFIVVEDNYPDPPYYSRNTFREAVGIKEMTFHSGLCSTSSVTLILDDAWIAENLKIIIWAQKPAPQFPANVFQSAQTSWPFEPLPETGDGNNDGVVDLDDYELFDSVCLTGPAPLEDLPPMCRMSFDADEDEDVDLRDFIEMQAEFAPTN